MDPILSHDSNTTDSSKLCDYMKCPRYYFYRHVLGWDSLTLNNHLIFGTAWHLAMEHLLLHGYGNNSVIAAFDLFYKEYRKSFNPNTDELFDPKTPDNAFLILGQYARHYNREMENIEVLYTEIAGQVAIDEKRHLSFRMDSILKNTKTGKIYSREHKTASRTWMWDEQWLLAIQPGTYSHVLYCLYPHEDVLGIEMNGVFFIKRKKDPYDFRRLMVRKNLGQMQQWMDTVQYYMWEIEREYEILGNSDEASSTLYAFPMRPIACMDYGRLCSYHDFCLAWQNPLRRMHNVPEGFCIRYWNPMEEASKVTFNFDKKEY